MGSFAATGVVVPFLLWRAVLGLALAGTGSRVLLEATVAGLSLAVAGACFLVVEVSVEVAVEEGPVDALRTAAGVVQPLLDFGGAGLSVALAGASVPIIE